MRKTIAFALAVCSLALTAGITKAQGTPQQVLDLFPTTTDTPIYLINNYTGIPFKNFQYPSKAQTDTVRALFVALDANDLENITALTAKLNMIVVRLSAPNSNVLFFRVPNQGLQIVFFWRVGAMQVPGDPSTYGNPVQPLVEEVPHQGVDGTGLPASIVLQKTSARIMMLNADSQDSSLKHPVCQPNSHISDSAHSWYCLFNQAHIGLAQLYPDAFYISFNHVYNEYLIDYNAFNGEFTTAYKSGPRLFMLSCPNNFPTYFWQRFHFCTHDTIALHNPPINLIAEASALDGGGPCSPGKADTGRFMFIEMGNEFCDENGDAGRCGLLSNTINETMVKWVQGS